MYTDLHIPPKPLLYFPRQGRISLLFIYTHTHTNTYIYILFLATVTIAVTFTFAPVIVDYYLSL